MEDTEDKISISEAVDAAAEAVGNVFNVVVEDVVEEVAELSESTKAEMAAGVAHLQKFFSGE